MQEGSWMRRLLRAPEPNVAVFAFLLNYPWEFLQAPLFASLAGMPHWQGIRLCTAAALGDAAISLGAFWIVAVATGTRSWMLRPDRRRTALFVAIGLVATVIAERLATGVLGRWQYAETMPLVPVLEVGLAPFAQWLLLPPLLLFVVRRQIA